jgi:hypothetical protein
MILGIQRQWTWAMRWVILRVEDDIGLGQVVGAWRVGGQKGLVPSGLLEVGGWIICATLAHVDLGGCPVRSSRARKRQSIPSFK